MKYKAVLFDLDDTLLKTYPAKWAQHRETAKRFYNTELVDDVIRQHWGKPTRELVGVYYGLNDTIENMVTNYRSLDEDFSKSLHDDSIKILDYLINRKVFIGLVTNATRKTVLTDLARLGVNLDLFDIVQTFDEVKAYKPDPKVFEAVLCKLAGYGIAAEHILYVGDDVTDHSAANTAGIDFIGVTTGIRTEAEFKRSGINLIIERLGALPEFLS